MRGGFRRFSIGFSFTILIVVAISLLFMNDIHDFVKLRGYNPPKEIAQLADSTTMHDNARRLFYVNHPEIADSEQFNQKCRENERSIVLGCYLTGQSGIYLLHVTDDRLAGIQEVTAAHEFLHAAYERLGTKERKRVDALLADAFEKLNDQRVRDTIELYRKQNPAVVPNELHSILGTEVRNLSEELEQYYARYFRDRHKIVSFAESYEQAFIERRNAIREYDTQLTELKVRIDDLSARLTTEESELRTMRSQMEAYRSNSQLKQYNDLVPVYNAKVEAFNADIDTVTGMVAKYNDIVQTRNSIAAEEAELVDAIDSREVVPDQQ